MPMPMPQQNQIKANKANKVDVAKKDSTMKVTLLSGFLGAGKTTLLKRILRLNNELSDAEKLKMAVIVNDMGEINLDAEEIKASKVVQEDAEMVEMHNGCICCTLRGDLLKTVKSLSEEGKFDYLVIESTGIGEPLPVAQTFAMDVDSMEPTDQPGQSPSEEKKLTVATDDKKSLFHYAILDTLVTVVDALNIYDVLSSIETLADENNISGMLGNTGSTQDAEKMAYDELEEEQKNQVFAFALSLDEDRLRKELEKRQLDTKGEKLELVQRLVKAFEVQMKIEAPKDNRPIATLWIDQIEFANVIVVSKASKFLEKQSEAKLTEIENLLKKLNPKARVIVPREDVYGDLDVSKTLINTGLFDMAESSASAGWAAELMKEEHNPETEEYGISSLTFVANDMPFHPERFAKILRGFGDYESANNVGVANNDSDDDGAVFQGVVRTKGQLWLANANAYPVRFQTAGTQADLRPEDTPFLQEIMKKIDEQERDQVDERSMTFLQNRIAKMKEDGFWTDKFGDRRSQLVFIGVGLNKAKMHKWLTRALLTEEESVAMGGVEGWKNLKDPFYNGQLPTAHFEYDGN